MKHNRRTFHIFISVNLSLLIFSFVIYTIYKYKNPTIEGMNDARRWNPPKKIDVPGYVPTEQVSGNPAVIPHRFTYPFNSPQNE